LTENQYGVPRFIKAGFRKNRLSYLPYKRRSPLGDISGVGVTMTLRAGIIVSALNQMGDWNGMVIPLSAE